MAKVFLVPSTMLDVCFNKCGKIRVAQVIVDGLPTMPCLEEKCPFEEGKLYIGKHRIFGKTYETYIRKLKVSK